MRPRGPGSFAMSPLRRIERDQAALLRESIAASKGALLVYTPTDFPQQHADTSHNLAIDRGRYESLPNAAKEIPFDKIPPAK